MAVPALPVDPPALLPLNELRRGLRADCSACVGLCCVAPAFTASADFAIDKPAGTPCPNLRGDSSCGIHDRLRPSGFPGCATFDCFGAGQQTVQVTHGGSDWRAGPEVAASMFASFTALRQLHELLWHLAEALTLALTDDLLEAVAAARSRVTALTALAPDELAQVDAARERYAVGPLLERVSLLARAGEGLGPEHRGDDLMGARLRGADLRGASLRGAYLIGADLRGADLRRADLLGTDLRAADVRGARLAGAIFLTQPQLDAARGDGATTLPEGLQRPRHWAAGTTTGRRAPQGD